MEKIKSNLFIGMLALIVFLNSCQKDILEPPLNLNITDEAIFTSVVNSDAFVSNIYSFIPSGFTPRVSATFIECATDDAIHGNQLDPSFRMASKAWGLNYNPDGIWTSYYQGIRKCNVALANLNKIETVDHGAEIKNDLQNITNVWHRDRMIGESFFLRGWFYFELLKRYGGVPIANKVYTIEDNTSLPRNTVEEVIEQIKMDCDSAAKYLPTSYIAGSVLSVNGGQPINNYFGRATKWSAQALKVKAYEYAASPIFNSNSEKIKWQRVVDAAKPFFDGSAGFTLSTTYDALFTGATSANPEIIWSRPEANRNTLERANYPVGFDLVTGGANPSQQLVDAYEMKTGVAITDANSGYTPANPYINRDPRLASTIVFNGTTFNGRVIEPFSGGLDGPQKAFGSQTGYYVKKWLRSGLNLTTNQTFAHHWIYYRLADMLLSYAEAKNELLDAPDAEVYKVLNDIRKRAGMPNLPAGLTKDQMRQRIRNERRIELAFEGHRYWDCRRWDIAKTVFNTPITGVKITKDATGAFTYTKYNVVDRSFDPHMNLYPIPLNEILGNPNMVQNPGW